MEIESELDVEVLGRVYKENLKERIIDLFVFMGQSNMAGRGLCDAEHPEMAPVLIENAGYEYRAVTSPGTLHVLTEPFGRHENRQDGIDDRDMKTGSMVTAFVNAYYGRTGVPVVGISASKGGSRISEWQPGGGYLSDAVSRLKAAVEFLGSNGYVVRHKFMVWCQGESDGDIAKPASEYRQEFCNLLMEMRNCGIEKCFMIRIGNYNGKENRDYGEIMGAQEEIARIDEDVIMVSRAFEQMRERGLMKDDFHYFQQAYNEVGTEAGLNTAAYVNTL